MARRLDARIRYEPADALQPALGPDRVGRDQQRELGGARRAPVVDRVDEWLAENRLVGEHQDMRARSRGDSRSTTTWSTG